MHRIPIYCLGFYSCESLRQPRTPRVLRTERLHFLWKQNKTKTKTRSCQSTKGLRFTYLLSRSLLGLFPPLAFRAASQNMRFLRWSSALPAEPQRAEKERHTPVDSLPINVFHFSEDILKFRESWESRGQSETVCRNTVLVQAAPRAGFLAHRPLSSQLNTLQT